MPIFDGFRMFRFLSFYFYGWVTFRDGGYQHVVLTDFCPKLCSTLCTGDFPRSRLNSACLSNADFCPKLKILLQISPRGNSIFGAKSLWTNHSTFLFHYPVRSCYSIDLDFFRSTDYWSQSACSLTFFRIPF